MLGGAIAGREPVLVRAAAEGHDVGNHTRTHPRLTLETDAAIRDELARTSDAIEAVTSVRPRFFRPPHLEHDGRVDRIACALGLCEIVLCSIDPADWSEADAARIAERVLVEAKAGAIVDLHDGRPQYDSSSQPSRRPTVEAVARIVPALQREGYRLVSVSELLAAPAA